MDVCILALIFFEILCCAFYIHVCIRVCACIYSAYVTCILLVFCAQLYSGVLTRCNDITITTQVHHLGCGLAASLVTLDRFCLWLISSVYVSCMYLALSRHIVFPLQG